MSCRATYSSAIGLHREVFFLFKVDGIAGEVESRGNGYKDGSLVASRRQGLSALVLGGREFGSQETQVGLNAPNGAMVLRHLYIA